MMDSFSIPSFLLFSTFYNALVIGGLLSRIPLGLCASTSREWINTDIQSTNGDESSELVGQLGYQVTHALHPRVDYCQEVQQTPGSQISNDYTASR